jgi:hypothetical protein
MRLSHSGPHPPTTIYIEYLNETKSAINRLLLFVRHPEHFYYNWKLKYSLKIDQALTVAAQLVALDLTYTFFETRVRYYTTTRMTHELEDQASDNSSTWVPTHGPSAWKIITDMLALEEDGATFSYVALPPRVLEWADRVLGVSNESEIRCKYHNTFWEGGSKRDLKAIRDKWIAATPPVERQTRQRQTRGSMQEARDQIDIGRTEEGNVALIKILDRHSRSAIGSKTAQFYATTKTYAYEDYLIRKPGSTLRGFVRALRPTFCRHYRQILEN